MGGCLASTRIEKYSEFFEKLQVGALNDLWTTVKVFKLKNLFAKHTNEQTGFMHFNGFKNIMVGLTDLPEGVKRRLFEIFDRENVGMLNFNNFLTGLSICTFGPAQTVSAILFMSYDEFMTKELTPEMLDGLINDNQRLFLDQPVTQDQKYLFREAMLVSKPVCTAEHFVAEVSKYLHLEDYREIFNVFVEERVEKQLVENWNAWNNIYNEEQERYVSYVLCNKWFQSWKIYAEDHYKILLSNTARDATMKFTRKTAAKSKTKINTLKNIEVEAVSNKEELKNKNLNFVHGDIGQKPRQIYNNVLEGEYEGTLRPYLNSKDYTLVSEKVWGHLHQIYGGGPAFRRTGAKTVDMHPKLVKLYSMLFRSKIDYSSEVVREVPSPITFLDILTQSVDINETQASSFVAYFKAVGEQWEKLTDFHTSIDELHSNVLLFIIYLPVDQEKEFVEHNVTVAPSLDSISIGDYLDVNHEGETKRVVFMGTNNQGKYIFHTSKSSYTKDFCLDENEFRKRAKFIGSAAKNELALPVANGIKSSSDQAFLSSILPVFFYIPELAGLLKTLDPIKYQSDSLVGHLASIYRNVTGMKRSSSRGLLQALKVKLPCKQNQVALTPNEYFNQYLSTLAQDFKSTDNLGKGAHLISEIFGIRKKMVLECCDCKAKKEEVETVNSLEVIMPQRKQLCYTVIYVPYCEEMKSKEIKKLGFSLPAGATLAQYKKAFEKVSGISHKNYLLAQVFHNNIIKNFSTAQVSQSLDKLQLYGSDEIYAFELYVDFSSFVKSHFRVSKDLDIGEVKVNQFVDCSSDDRWIFGKVYNVEYLTYTKRTIVTVVHTMNRDQEWKIGYDLFELSTFPTISYQFCEQFFLRICQRKFNESTNEMDTVGTPLVVTLAEWMRWKEFFYLVYLQMRRFIPITQETTFEDDHLDKPKTMKSLKNLDRAEKKKTIKLQQKKKLNDFKEYLHSENFPYKLNIVDLDGRCCVCFKFVKSQVFKGETDFYCTGCKLSESDPISWQVKCTEIKICIDWKAKAIHDAQTVVEDASYTQLQAQIDNTPVQFADCLKDLALPTPTSKNIGCCDSGETLCTTTIDNNPEIMVVALKKDSNTTGSSVERKLVYQTQNVKLGKKGTYYLYAVITLDDLHKFKTYLNINKLWYQYDGENVTVLDKKSIIDKNAELLIYKLAS